MGHALLFQGKYEAAITVYKDYLGDALQDSYQTNAKTVLNDLKALEDRGAIPAARAADVTAIRKLLEKKE